VIFC
jgi:predicted transcriptional regulator